MVGSCGSWLSYIIVSHHQHQAPGTNSRNKCHNIRTCGSANNTQKEENEKKRIYIYIYINIESDLHPKHELSVVGIELQYVNPS